MQFSLAQNIVQELLLRLSTGFFWFPINVAMITKSKHNLMPTLQFTIGGNGWNILCAVSCTSKNEIMGDFQVDFA